MNRHAQDRRIFKELIRYLDKKKTSAKFPDHLMLDIGKFFLGSPYVADTLETKRGERLVANLREYDCTTFVETVIAFAWLMKSRRKSFNTFRRILREIRYRQGQLQGYSSRLHYFSDWIYDNQKKGILKDVTGEIGGRPRKKTISFMTKHPNLYPPLNNEQTLRRVKSIERTMGHRSLFFIPKKALRPLEGRIRDGDLIAITTTIKGLDVQHVGLAARVKDRIHLLHASSIEGKIVLSQKTLYGYLMQSRTRSGVIVARALL